MKLTYRPLVNWRGPLTTDRKGSPFEATLRETERLLGVEVERIGGASVVVELAIAEADLRADGRPYAGADFAHPGVVVSFTSDHGPLTYATDVYHGQRWSPSGHEPAVSEWQANLRAVALGLQALRAVDRYGITRSGEQYTGWKALPSGLALPEHAAMTREQAAGVFFDLCPAGFRDRGTPGEVLDLDAGELALLYRQAARRHHPDADGGDRRRFEALREAFEVLTGKA